MSKRIKALREGTGMTQVALAKRARITQPYLAQLEGGKRTGTVAVLKRLAKVLGVSIADLVE